MRYWDASAIVPLVVDEGPSDQVRGWLSEDPRLVTWGWTWVEVASAVERRVREGGLTRAQRRETLERFGALADRSDEVVDLLAVRTRALSLLARHPLGAADAAQLGSALVVADPTPGSLPFVCLDRRLAVAAEMEGLRVVGLY